MYEYIAVYVDALCIAAKKPEAITDSFMEIYKYKLKDVSPIDYHLSYDFSMDPDETLHFGPQCYKENTMDAYVRRFPAKDGSPELCHRWHMSHLSRVTIPRSTTLIS